MMFSLRVNIGCIYVCLSASASDVSAGTVASPGSSVFTHLTEQKMRSKPADEACVGEWTIRGRLGE